MPSTSTGVPNTGISAKAALAKAAPVKMEGLARMSAPISGCTIMVDTSTSPVSRQMTPVDQNAPVMEMSAWSAGFFVLAAAATMGAVPSPDSLENRPRAQPNCRAITMPEPTAPPKAAFGVKAPSRISPTASPSTGAFMPMMTRQPSA